MPSLHHECLVSTAQLLELGTLPLIPLSVLLFPISFAALIVREVTIPSSVYSLSVVHFQLHSSFNALSRAPTIIENKRFLY
jgi:hypothetical protein